MKITASCNAAAPQAGTAIVNPRNPDSPRNTSMISFRPIETRDVSFNAEDGFPIAGTLVSNPANDGPLVLISSATAVSRGYYLKFALATVEAGARAALIYDYRGVAGSQPPEGWNKRLNMKDWGILDMPAAIAFLDTQAPGHKMVGLGHSIGGTILGLCGQADRFARFAMVAAALGTLSLTDERLMLSAKINLVAKPICALLGRVPGWLGIGETLPATVFTDWARWCQQPNYLFDDADISEKSRFAEVEGKILSIVADDDPWATKRAVLALQARFPGVSFDRWHLIPRAFGADEIGHFGFFRSRFSDTLWPKLTEWICSDSKLPSEFSTLRGV